MVFLGDSTCTEAVLQLRKVDRRRLLDGACSHLLGRLSENETIGRGSVLFTSNDCVFVSGSPGKEMIEVDVSIKDRVVSVKVVGILFSVSSLRLIEGSL